MHVVCRQLIQILQVEAVRTRHCHCLVTDYTSAVIMFAKTLVFCVRNGSYSFLLHKLLVEGHLVIDLTRKLVQRLHGGYLFSVYIVGICSKIEA